LLVEVKAAVEAEDVTLPEKGVALCFTVNVVVVIVVGSIASLKAALHHIPNNEGQQTASVPTRD
jgi:hypothetical protein